MCLIIYRPVNAQPISNEILETAHDANPDGIGIMFINKFKKIKIVKTFNALKALHYIRFLESNNVEFGLHFRYATHGKISLDNCHPFFIDNLNGYLMHNGILPDAKSLSFNDKIPDTVGFIDKYMKYKSYSITQIEKLISTNKFLQLSPVGFTVYNREYWTDHEDCLYSNSYSLPNDDSFAWYQPKPLRYYNNGKNDNVIYQKDYFSYGNNFMDYDDFEIKEISNRFDDILTEYYSFDRIELKSLDVIDKLDLVEGLLKQLSRQTS